MNKHQHDYYLGVEAVFTDDGEPQPRQQIFLECVECDFIFRENEIVDYIKFLESNCRGAAEWIRNHM